MFISQAKQIRRQWDFTFQSETKRLPVFCLTEGFNLDKEKCSSFEQFTAFLSTQACLPSCNNSSDSVHLSREELSLTYFGTIPYKPSSPLSFPPFILQAFTQLKDAHQYSKQKPNRDKMVHIYPLTTSSQVTPKLLIAVEEASSAFSIHPAPSKIYISIFSLFFLFLLFFINSSSIKHACFNQSINQQGTPKS